MDSFRDYLLAVVLSAVLLCNQVVFCSARNSWFANEELSESFSERKITIKMPGTRPLKRDTYLCTAVQLLSQKEYIVDFEPIASQKTSHHMLLFGCDLPGSSSPSWDCKDGPYRECLGSQEILYAWAKDAPAKQLPKDVGFAVGGESNIKYLVLQVHYASVDTFQGGSKDYSGFTLHTRQHSLPYLGGIYLLWAYSGTIPPETSGVHVDVACQYKKSEPMYAFAFRTHAHKLAKVITGYRIRNGVWTLIGKGDPQAPQAFYPMDTTVEIKTGDILVARCTYDSRGHNVKGSVHMGASGHDEMCNFYIMYYSNAARLQYSGGDCGEQNHPDIFKNFPSGSDTPLVNSSNVKLAPSHIVSSLKNAGDLDHKMSHEDFHRKVTPSTRSYKEDVIDSLQTESQPVIPVVSSPIRPSEPVKAVTQATAKEQDHSNLRLVTDWPSLTPLEASKLGQVTGVSMDSMGQVVVFHRGGRIWDDSTFDSSNVFRNADMVGTISEHTIWILDSATGKVKGFWGKNLFYLPHGLTIDHEDNLWVTDVGSHQVFKFSPLSDRTRRLLALGDKLVPGSSSSRFCKPTSVAVDKNGEFFVADGYCNSRIMKFSSAGKLLSSWGKPSYAGSGVPPPGSFFVPHSLALDSAKHSLYVADRENGRVQVFSSISGTFVDEIKLPEFGGLVYAVDYSDSGRGGVLHVVNGPNSLDQNRKVPVKGFTIRVSDKSLLQTWPSEKGQVLSQPHDLASSPDGTDVYVVEIGPNKVWKFSSKRQLAVTAPRTTSVLITNELLSAHGGSGFNPKQPGNRNSVATKASVNSSSISLELVEERARLVKPGYQTSSVNTERHQESSSLGNGDHRPQPGGDREESSVITEGHQESSGPGGKEQSSKEDGTGETSSVNSEGHQGSSGPKKAHVNTEQDGDRETPHVNSADHQDSVDQDNDTSPGIVNPQQRLSHNSTSNEDKVGAESNTSELASQGSVVWVNVTETAFITPEPTASGSGKGGPQNDALDSDERDDNENIVAGVIPALIILSVLAVPIVFLLLISIVLRLRAYHRDRNREMSGFHNSKKDLSVGRTRGWLSYMNCCDRQKYRFNRVTLSDFYSDSDSDGV